MVVMRYFPLIDHIVLFARLLTEDCNHAASECCECFHFRGECALVLGELPKGGRFLLLCESRVGVPYLALIVLLGDSCRIAIGWSNGFFIAIVAILGSDSEVCSRWKTPASSFP